MVLMTCLDCKGSGEEGFLQLAPSGKLVEVMLPCKECGGRGKQGSHPGAIGDWEEN